MSIDYLERDGEVFSRMQNLFNQLYSNEDEFKKAIDSKGIATLKLNEEDTYYIEEVGSALCLHDYDWFIGDETPISITFTNVFEYVGKSVFTYSCGVILEEDREYDGYNYSIVEPDSNYPSMDRVLIKKGNESEWKEYKKVPSIFNKLLSELDILDGDDEDFYDFLFDNDGRDSVSLVKIYNENGDLLIDLLNPFSGVLLRITYGEDSKIDSIIEKIVSSVNSLKVSVNEVFIFHNEKLSSSRLKKNNTGEYTLVIE